MNGRKTLILFVMVLIVSMALAPGTAAAQATVTDFTGTEILVDLLHPGDISISPGGAWKGRGRVWKLYHDTTDPRMTGTVIVTSNMNSNPFDEGPAWGTMKVAPEEYDGTWEATWHSPPGRPDIITAIGHGTGEFEGMTAWWTFTYEENNPNGSISGRILDPNSE
jgi:hypothetical protein